MIDKRLLEDSVTVEFINERDEWGKITYKDPVALDYVRFDRTHRLVNGGVRDNNSTSENRGVIIVYPKFNDDVVVDDTWKNAKVIDDHGEYTIKEYQVNYLFGKVFSYELEVI